MFALLLAAGLAAQNRPPTSLDGRLALLEARQMLEGQQVWQLRAELPPEVVKAIADVDLHLQHDLEQEDKVRDLTHTVALLQERLAAVELLLQDKAAIENPSRIPVMQMQALDIPAKPAARKKRAAQDKKPRKQQSGRARVAESP